MEAFDRRSKIVVSMGMTFQVTPFNSVTANVTLETTCVPETKEEAYQNLRNEVESKVFHSIAKQAQKFIEFKAGYKR